MTLLAVVCFHDPPDLLSAFGLAYLEFRCNYQLLLDAGGQCVKVPRSASGAQLARDSFQRNSRLDDQSPEEGAQSEYLGGGEF